jgi:hypothetical protein
MKGWNIYIIFLLLSFVSSTGTVNCQNLYSITSLSFNTRQYDEFAPVIYNNGLIIATHRMQFVYKTQVDLNEKPINDLFFVQKLDGNEWGPLQFLTGEVNSKYHEGKCSLTKDGNSMYFTRFQNDSAGNILRSVKSGSDWGAPYLISLNSPKYRIKDPCITPDGKKLFFASNAKGGFGGYDIYVSVYERGDWSTPKNLGSNVNTKGDEIAPFYQTNGRLYFSSDKLPGLGHFDIFYSREYNGVWIKSKSLPETINSNRDDLYYFSDAGDSTGYFCSNRNRSYDIFSFRLLWPGMNNCKPQKKNRYTYNFFEKGSVDNDTTSWVYEWDFGDSTKVRGKKADANHTFASKGQYLVQLNVVDTLTNEVMLSEDAYMFDASDEEQPFITAPDTAVQEQAVKFDASATYLPAFKKIDFYYWDFGDGERDTGLSPDHIYYLPGKYTVKLCVQSAPNEEGKSMQDCVFKEIFIINSSFTK